jgi:glycosyltransferase involved in cell wall biosynthesis
MLEFISAVYNEEAEIDDLVEHIYPYVDAMHFTDDGSTDTTLDHLGKWWDRFNEEYYYNNEDYYTDPLYGKFTWHSYDHTGLCEVGRIRALEMCDNDSWVLMLDADERFAPGVLEAVVEFCKAPPEGVTHVYFSQKEFIDGRPITEFAKVKLFKKSAAHLPEIIHRDPTFDGEAYNFGGVVIHRKTHNKQIMRELQYLDTYDKLLDAGKVTQGDVDWFKGMHHYVKERHG